MNERCGNCNYFCAVRKFPIYEEVLTHVCVVALLEDKIDYILETTEYDMCECWRRRED